MDEIITFDEEILNQDLANHMVVENGVKMIRHFLLNRFYDNDNFPNIPSSYNGLLNSSYKHTLERFNNYYNVYDIENIIWEIERLFRIKWFYDKRQEFQHSLIDERYYKILSELIIDSENFFQVKNEVMELVNLKSNPLLMMNKKEKRSFDLLPDKLKVYRGVLYDGSVDINYLVGSSWTTNYEQSEWFSKRNFIQGNQSIVFEYEVEKKDILSYFTRRKEYEVLLDFRLIDIKKVIVKTL